MSIEEPPGLFSESTFPLSSAFLHHALLLDLAFKQPAQKLAFTHRWDGRPARILELHFRGGEITHELLRS
jgi:hypothetical protein